MLFEIRGRAFPALALASQFRCRKESLGMVFESQYRLVGVIDRALPGRHGAEVEHEVGDGNAASQCPDD
jgi:hypothetical protein